MTEVYYAAGSTLANMANLEVTVSSPFTPLDNGRIPLLGPTSTRLGDSFLRRDGKVNSAIVSDDATDTERKALNVALFTDQVTPCAELYMTLLSDDGFWSPFLVVVDRPYEMQNYVPINETYYRNGLVLPLNWCRLQSVTKTGNYTATTSDRLIYVDTSSGNVTITLFAASAAVANTAYSFVKTVATNSLIIARAGSDLIDGATSKTLTAKNARADLYSDHVSTFTSVAY